MELENWKNITVVVVGFVGENTSERWHSNFIPQYRILTSTLIEIRFLTWSFLSNEIIHWNTKKNAHKVTFRGWNIEIMQEE